MFQRLLLERPFLGIFHFCMREDFPNANQRLTQPTSGGTLVRHTEGIKQHCQEIEEGDQTCEGFLLQKCEGGGGRVVVNKKTGLALRQQAIRVSRQEQAGRLS